MRLVPVTYRAKRIRGKLAWVNVYALANVGRATGAVVVAGAAVTMLGSGAAQATPCAGGGNGTISAAGTGQSWSTGSCTVTSSGSVTLTNTIVSGTNAALQATGTLGTLSNSGTIVNNLTTAAPTDAEAVGLSNVGSSITSVLNNAGGAISGAYAGTMSGTNNKFTITGIGNYTQSGTLGTIGTLVNNGIISASNTGTFGASQLTVTSPGVTFRAISNQGLIGTLTNNSTIAGTIGGNFTSNGTYFPYGVGIENGDGATVISLTNSAGALIKAK